MNDEQMKLARELAGHPNFSGRRGMCIVNGRFPLFVMGDGVGYRGLMGGVPDLTDDATGGVLWAMAGGPHVAPALRGVRCIDHGAGFTADTLAEACARLLLAQWAREVTP